MKSVRYADLRREQICVSYESYHLPDNVILDRVVTAPDNTLFRVSHFDEMPPLAARVFAILTTFDSASKASEECM